MLRLKPIKEETMNKRIISLLLCAIMVLSVILTGCSQKTDDEAIADVNETASESTMTLTMYLMAESEVDPDQVAKIEEAVNKITKSKFKTRLVLRYFTEEEYTEALEEAIKKTKEEKNSKKPGSKPSATTTTTVEETVINELGVTELKYPSVSDYQVDIFYLGGYDKFNQYYESGWLADLSDNLTTESKTLKTYIFSDYFTNINFTTEDISVIPNNLVVGEYTYMLLNKDVLKEYNYSSDTAGFSTKGEFTSLTCDNVQDILDKVARYNRDTYVPLWSGTGALDVSGVGYIGVEDLGNNNFALTNGFSLVGGTPLGNDRFGVLGNHIPFANIFNDSKFTTQLTTLASYKANGYYATESEAGKDFAVGYVKGGPQDVLQYADDYEIVVVEKPRMTTADAYDHTFAVSKFTTDTTRSMRILTYLNTNETFRNLILYGIEGENYEIVLKEAESVNGEIKEYKTVRRLNDKYMMAPEKTGNVLLAYPLESELPNIREYQKIQNSDALTSLDFGFRLDYQKSVIHFEAMSEYCAFTEAVYAKLLEFCAPDTVIEEGSVDLDTYIKSLRSGGDLLRANALVNLMLSQGHYKGCGDEFAEQYRTNVEKYGVGDSLAGVYYKWLLDKGMYEVVVG